MDASRLVFVSVKDAKPRRKIAVPVPDEYTWGDFLHQVQTKLKLAGVESIFLASSGEKVTKLDDLQDIDELHVIEAAAPSALHNGGNHLPDVRAQSGQAASTSGLPNGNDSTIVIAAEQQQYQHGNGVAPHYVPNAQAAASSHHRMGVADVSEGGNAAACGDGEGDMGAKYAKRSSGIRRSLQRFFPSLFAPSLPVTTRDVKEEGRKQPEGARPARKRRRSRGLFNLRNGMTLFMVLCFLGVLTLLYARLWPRLP